MVKHSLFGHYYWLLFNTYHNGLARSAWSNAEITFGRLALASWVWSDSRLLILQAITWVNKKGSNSFVVFVYPQQK